MLAHILAIFFIGLLVVEANLPLAQQAKKNPALAHFSNTISALRNEPLAKTEKRFASEALTEAVDPLQALRSSFMKKESKMPRMSYQ